MRSEGATKARTWGRLLLGGSLGAVCALLSIAVAGGGHGWNSAWPFGLASLMLYPLALLSGERRQSLTLAAIALALDIGLLAMSWREGFGYIAPVWPLAVAWLALWFGWQALVWRNCARH